MTDKKNVIVIMVSNTALVCFFGTVNYDFRVKSKHTK